ncbi:MAG: APC family permease [Ignavibacteriae bacterium]|nr:MAG: APC family permease [Ignavibacteriota bacterium]
MESSSTRESIESDPLPLGNDLEGRITEKIKHAILGAPRSIKDPGVFHRISLIAFLAWVGLGADGLSSSAYGPDESFRALGQHTYLAVALALATGFTVFIISYSYSRIIEHFPSGGGGYIVASRLLGPHFGVISGSALLVDYVLTISVSIASGADQVFSVLPPGWHQYKLMVVASVIVLLMILNLRGIKESVTVLLPIFLVFLATHVILIFGGIGSHIAETSRVVGEMHNGFSNGLAALGLAGMLGIFARAYSMGAGTYTGIEAVSNGIQIMREPKIETAKKTMLYMAISLAITAAGIMICYLLYHVTPVPGKTMNAVLLNNFAGDWIIQGIPAGWLFVVITLGSEAALLFVAAQAGFIDGPRVMANMAVDSWLPRRFASLSERLTMQNGVIIIAGAAIGILLLTRGDTTTLVLMYSINVFLTFSLSQLGMVRYWIKHRAQFADWTKHIMIHLIGLVLCFSILVVNVYEKFAIGGWITLVITACFIVLCMKVKRHYSKVNDQLKRLDDILTDIPGLDFPRTVAFESKASTAVLMVKEYSGFGIHTLLSIPRLFPNQFKNVIFVSVVNVDASTLKGKSELDELIKNQQEHLAKYVKLANQLGYGSVYRIAEGTDVMDELEKLSAQIAKECPRSIFFAGKLVFEREKWYQRILHNETAYAIQRRLQFGAMNCMVLPVRVFATQK